MRVGLCGEIGQVCCRNSGASDVAPRYCIADAACDFAETETCVHCGMKDQLCCEGDNECDPNLNCDHNRCRPCGGPGEACCHNDELCRSGTCNSEFRCCDPPEDEPVLFDHLEDYKSSCDPDDN